MEKLSSFLFTHSVYVSFNIKELNNEKKTLSEYDKNAISTNDIPKPQILDILYDETIGACPKIK